MKNSTLNPIVLANAYCIPIAIGIISFWVLGGFPALNPIYLNWLPPGDATAGQIAWTYYKDSQWTFPLGLNPNYGMNVSSSIVYGLDVPILGAFFKIWRNYLPANFQYLGIWYLICFIFQSLFSWKILSLYFDDLYFKISGTILLVFAPAFLMTIGPIASLSSHFLILISIYLVLTPHTRFSFIKWIGLLFIALGVQFYLFFAIYILWLSNLCDKLYKKIYSLKRIFPQVILLHFVILLTAWQLGFFVLSAGDASIANYINYEIPNLSKYSDASSSLNLLAIFYDPDWSYIENNLRHLIRHFDNVYFLGFGLILAITFLIFLKQKIILNHCFQFIRNNPFISVALFFLTIFAISNKIHFGNFVFGFELSSGFYSTANMLRNSFRMIWPLYYFLVIFTLVGIFKLFPIKLSQKLIFFILLIQLADTSFGWGKIASNVFRQQYPPYDQELKDSFWRRAPEFYNNVQGIPEVAARVSFENFATYASRHHLATNFALLARYDLKKIKESNLIYSQYLYTGSYNPSGFYIIDDDLVPAVNLNLDKKVDLFARIDGVNVLAPNWFTLSGDKPSDFAQLLSTQDFTLFPKINTPIQFGKSSLGAHYLQGIAQYELKGWGWCYPEDWGTWSEGNKAKLTIPYPKNATPKFLKFVLRSFVPNENILQKAHIYLDGSLVSTLNFSSHEPQTIKIELPQIPEKNFALIEIKTPNAISPNQLRLGPDTRKLGVGILEAEFN